MYKKYLCIYKDFFLFFTIKVYLDIRKLYIFTLCRDIGGTVFGYKEYFILIMH